MARKHKVDVYRTVNATTEIRLYEYEVRRLFRLPRRKGKITGASFDNGRLNIEFTEVKGTTLYI